MALADMPWIEPATLRQLAQALQQGAALVGVHVDGLARSLEDVDRGEGRPDARHGQGARVAVR